MATVGFKGLTSIITQVGQPIVHHLHGAAGHYDAYEHTVVCSAASAQTVGRQSTPRYVGNIRRSHYHRHRADRPTDIAE